MDDQAFLAQVIARGARHGDGPVCAHRTPLSLSAPEWHRWRRLLPAVHRLLRKVRAALLADLDRGPDSLAARLGTPLDAIDWARIDPGFPDVAPLARLDAYVVDGQPRFLELNAESPAGMGYASALAPLFPGAGHFLDPLPRVVSTVRALAREWGVASRRASIAIVDLPGVATAPEFELLATAFRAAGHPVVIAPPGQLSFDGESLRAGSIAIDVLYRRFLVRDLRRQPGAFAAIMDAYRARRVCMVNSLRTCLLHNKAIFALLHEPSFALSPAEHRLVSRHFPLTLLVSPRNQERLRREREGWVLKPVDAHGGEGVVLGWTATASAWDDALSRPYPQVAQLRVPAPTGRFHDARDGKLHERVIDTGPFLARGKLAGFLCRLAEGELANVSGGKATMVPVFEAGR
ncbi:MAG: hypothetical protein FJ090_12185 [Deltaproteobacteria bacterium]|nr:hypothetical protein [Deltaproteobacteria bacterium]